jgi:hypothetical protein
LALYFLPTMIGLGRDVTNPGMLALVNFLMGWTVLGWCICIIWAVCGQTLDQKIYYAERAASIMRGERRAP